MTSNSLLQQMLEILQQELDQQEKILELLAQERAAIAKVNQEMLSQLGVEKSKLIDKAQSLEQSRVALLQGHFDGAVPRFEVLLEHCNSEKQRDNLENLGHKLKGIANTVKDFNAQNGQLIRDSLGIIASTIAIMRSSTGSELPTYGNAGKLTSEAPDPAFSSGKGRGFSREV